VRKPNLFIVGAPKSGTSLLWTILNKHEDIFFSSDPEKEINYFSFDELNFNSYYKSYKVSNEKDYLSLFKKGQSVKYLVDGSVSYFAYPSIPKKLYKFNSNAKIIIIVRDPILRAFSHYNMDKRMGYASEPFSKYLENEDNQYNQFFHQYIENSLYYKHTSNYLEYFDENQVFVLQLEKIYDELDRLYNFLDIKNESFVVKKEKINTNKTPINIFSRTLQHNRYLTTVLKKLIPSAVVRFFDFLLYSKAKEVSLIESDRLLLDSYLRKDYLMFNKKYLR
jgi:hypothetical protein